MRPSHLQRPSGVFLTAAFAAVVAATTVATGRGLVAVDDDEATGLGPPALYTELRDARPEPAGHIRGGQLRLDRFDIELSEGELYVVPPIGERLTVAVYLGRGVVRAYPPDGVEHQQLKKLIDDDYLEEEFDRFIFWFTGDLGEQLVALADGVPGRDAEAAADLLEDRRQALLEHQLANPDSRVLTSLWRATTLPASFDAEPPYFYAEIDSREHDWFSIEVEPREREEVRVSRFDRGRKLANVWMGFHAVDEFDTLTGAATVGGFPRDPEVEGPADPTDDDDDWNFRDFGLSPRTLVPDRERWSPRVSVSRVDVDLALEGNGDAVASVALVIEPLDPLAALRLLISPVLEVTDVRWRVKVPNEVDDVRTVPLLAPDAESDEDVAGTADIRRPDEPAALTGDPLHYVQETHNRRLDDDLYEPWITVLLPRPVGAGERFILELTYEGELVERLRASRGYLLKDTNYWIPRHPDNRRRRFNLTFRVPERFRIASGGALVDEHVVDDTRIMRWTMDEPVRSTMAFHYGRFDVDDVTREGLPSIAVYADRNHLGFAPGLRDKTIEDLTGSIRTYTDYFGPYPFDSLLVTETPNSRGQAFPGLVLLTFRAFGELHTGESELFRSHEVAHQWWGAGVDWEDYRDQWMSEGFAHYAAALYSLVGLEEEDQFLDMLDAWRHDVLGEVNIGQGIGLKRYGFRPEVIQKSDGHESGPVVAGYRLATSDTPMDYRLLVYEKGAFILHMIRMLLVDLDTGDDERFRQLMRSFVRDHVGGVANTAAFEAAVTRAFGEPMDWFFDQWVYGTDVPTYRPDLDVSPAVDAASPFLLHGTIRQEDVPSGFRMAVPIRVRFRDRPPHLHRIWVDGPEVYVEIPLPAEPTDIDFNHHYGVLAHVR